MAHDDPFTLDMFRSTSLSSGLDLGVTAFADDFDPDDDPDPTTPAPAKAGVGIVRQQTSKTETHRETGFNFHLTDSRGLARAWKERARDNITAIRLATEIEADERAATVEKTR